MNRKRLLLVITALATAFVMTTTMSFAFSGGNQSLGTPVDEPEGTIDLSQCEFYFSYDWEEANFHKQVQFTWDWDELTGDEYMHSVRQIPEVTSIYDPINEKELIEGEDYVISAPDSCDAGTYRMRFYGMGDYMGKHVEEYVIDPINIDELSEESINFNPIDRTYTGNPLGLKAYFEVEVNGNWFELKQDVDYTLDDITFIGDQTKMGRVDMEGQINCVGNFAGTLRMSDLWEDQTFYYIAPAKTKITSLKAGSKKLTVKWKKVSGADGYLIQAYGMKGSKDHFKVVRVKGAKNVSKTVTKLKSKYKYEVAVMPYKKVDGNDVYNRWCSYKKVKVK